MPMAVAMRGSTQDGKRSGQGIETYPNGNRYDCDWVGGKKNGRGILTYSNGNRYEGVEGREEERERRPDIGRW
eukprot:gene27124-35845_t